MRIPAICWAITVGATLSLADIAVADGPDHASELDSGRYGGWKISGAPASGITATIGDGIATAGRVDAPFAASFFSDPAPAMDTTYRENRDRNPGLDYDPRRHDSYWEMKVSGVPTWGGLTTDARIASSSFDPQSDQNFGDTDHRALYLSVRGSAKMFRYGLRYRDVGKDFEPLQKTGKKDDNYDSLRLWGSRWWGNFGVTSELVEDEFHSSRDDRPKFTERKARVSLNYLFSNWPSVGYTLSYAAGTRQSADEPDGYAAFDGDMYGVNSSFYVRAGTWSAGVDSSYKTVQEGSSGSRDYTWLSHSLNWSLYPSKLLFFSPSVTVYEGRYAEDQSRTQGWTLALSAQRHIPELGMRLNGYISQYSDQNETWQYGGDGIYAEAGVRWWLGGKQGKDRGTIDLNLSYNQYRDRYDADSDLDEMAVWLIYRFNSGPADFLNRARYLRSGFME